jgi:hypothetical protein
MATRVSLNDRNTKQVLNEIAGRVDLDLGGGLVIRRYVARDVLVSSEPEMTRFAADGSPMTTWAAPLLREGRRKERHTVGTKGPDARTGCQRLNLMPRLRFGTTEISYRDEGPNLDLPDRGRSLLGPKIQLDTLSTLASLLAVGRGGGWGKDERDGGLRLTLGVSSLEET